LLKAILFDLDGTVTRPLLDFDAIRREALVPEGVPILEFLETLDPPRRAAVTDILEQHEDRAARDSTLAPGAREILALARNLGILTGVVTRNSRRSVDIVLRKHQLAFNVVITREDGPPKPSPHPVLAACRALGVDPRDALMVGDYLFDVQAGKNARARTAFCPGHYQLPDDVQVDYRLSSLFDLEDILRHENAPTE